MEALCAAGASVSATDIEGMTALHKASAQGHLAVVEKLLDHGSDPSRRSKVIFKKKYQPPPVGCWNGSRGYVHYKLKSAAGNQTRQERNCFLLTSS